jgi:hypothetical protein
VENCGKIAVYIQKWEKIDNKIKARRSFWWQCVKYMKLNELK